MKESIDRQARELDPIKTECIQNTSEKKELKERICRICIEKITKTNATKLNN